MDILTNNLFFGIFLCLITFEIGLFISKKIKFPLLNPLLIALFLIIGFLKAFNIDFETFNNGAQFINMFLGPATVVLAVPLYKQFNLLKENFVPILVGITIGSFIGILSIISLSIFIGLDEIITISLIPKSVTTPIGLEISKQLGGLTPITILSIVISGITGAVIAPTMCKIFKITNPVAIGIGIGTASHAVGTSRALEIGETEGAMSSLSIGVAGIITVFLAPICYNLFSNFL